MSKSAWDASIGVNEDAVGGETLGTMTGDCVAVVEMAMLASIKFDLAAVVVADGHATIGMNRFDDGSLEDTKWPRERTPS